MSYSWFVFLGCSIFLPAIIGWVRFAKIAPAYYPFLICIWVGVVNELISMILPHLGYTTTVNNNIYVLLEALLLGWQMQRWGALGYHRLAFFIYVTGLIIVWLLEHIIFSSVHMLESWFRLLYSFALVILAIRMINNVILTERGALLRNPVFLICTGMVLYFTYKGMVEIFWIRGFGVSAVFLLNVYSVMIWINFITNIIYSFAVLWMQGKQRFSMPF